ncbi:hypothetical protein GH5_07891 [Leishmania sp. Ghana 2012 LV757]|uniref:Uncharacterized protein n=1 Tax=Leishmania orientalis TaxID=2249476 RepID=A0A836GLW0_9TRYP|nr:hypothetical protein LSCM4_07974 [Leishmania orientalis]KAG5510041.1 hypothetical protein GH5_07891 [Leishmania sp. Ghana 2012 LV757]
MCASNRKRSTHFASSTRHNASPGMSAGTIYPPLYPRTVCRRMACLHQREGVRVLHPRWCRAVRWPASSGRREGKGAQRNRKTANVAQVM